MKTKRKAKVKVTMSVTLSHLSKLIGEAKVCEVRAANVLECLEIMTKRYPSIRKWVYDKEGKVLPLVWFFVNDPGMKEKLAPEKFTHPLQDGDEVIIFFGKV